MKPEIACVAESKLHVENDHDDAFEVSGFILYRDDRIHKGGGGVALWVSDNMKHKIIDFVTVVKPVQIECVWIYLPKLNVALCCVYISPSQSAAIYKEIDDYFIKCADEFQTKHIKYYWRHKPVRY